MLFVIVVGSCYFLLTLLGSYLQSVDFCFPLYLQYDIYVYIIIYSHICVHDAYVSISPILLLMLKIQFSITIKKRIAMKNQVQT